MSKKVHPLQNKRFYKIKNSKNNFLCALCSAPRSMKFKKNLDHKQYLRIMLISTAISWLGYSVIGAESFFAIFIVWPVYETVNKLLYRKEIACPYCGFDATWYRRDVKKANELVKAFWSKNYPDLVNPPTLETDLENSTGNPENITNAPSQNSIN